MEKRFQQLFESTVKVLISMITLRPIVRRLFSFKGALFILIAISAFRIVDALVNAAGSVNLFGLFDLPREAVGWLYAIINITYYIALISVIILLGRLLSSYQGDETERALVLALRQGIITQHEFEQKRLVAQRARFAGVLSSLEAANVLTATTREQLVNIMDESHRRWGLKEALSQAHKSGAIDDAIYNRRLAELGLQ